ncbi:MAG: hypothetical protein EOL97_11755 [Spirochaetia bacterium]|nr:hypothetical protein [Spirochaetia bacterium]
MEKIIKKGQIYQYKRQSKPIYWEVLEVQKGGIKCYSNQTHKTQLMDSDLLQKNFILIPISKLNNKSILK